MTILRASYMQAVLTLTLLGASCGTPPAAANNVSGIGPSDVAGVDTSNPLATAWPEQMQNALTAHGVAITLYNLGPCRGTGFLQDIINNEIPQLSSFTNINVVGSWDDLIACAEAGTAASTCEANYESLFGTLLGDISDKTFRQRPKFYVENMPQFDQFTWGQAPPPPGPAEPT